MYRVKEIFLSLQGEGFHAGRKAVFCRLSGCNLWDGREESRSATHGACGAWCDTDFRGGEPMTAAMIAAQCAALWGVGPLKRWCVLTGGEPTLQADGVLVTALRQLGFSVALETNGTRPLPCPFEWVTVSPKAGSELVVTAGDELKIAWPQDLDLNRLASLPFAHRFLQPIDGPNLEANQAACVHRCLSDPRWRVSLQIHKVLGLL